MRTRGNKYSVPKNQNEARRFLEGIVSPYIKKVETKAQPIFQNRKYVSDLMKRYTHFSEDKKKGSGLLDKIVGNVASLPEVKIAPMKFGFDKETTAGLITFAGLLGAGMALDGFFRYRATH